MCSDNRLTQVKRVTDVRDVSTTFSWCRDNSNLTRAPHKLMALCCMPHPTPKPALTHKSKVICLGKLAMLDAACLADTAAVHTACCLRSLPSTLAAAAAAALSPLLLVLHHNSCGANGVQPLACDATWRCTHQHAVCWARTAGHAMRGTRPGHQARAMSGRKGQWRPALLGHAGPGTAPPAPPAERSRLTCSSCLRLPAALRCCLRILRLAAASGSTRVCGRADGAMGQASTQEQKQMRLLHVNCHDAALRRLPKGPTQVWECTFGALSDLHPRQTPHALHTLKQSRSHTSTPGCRHTPAALPSSCARRAAAAPPRAPRCSPPAWRRRPPGRAGERRSRPRG